MLSKARHRVAILGFLGAAGLLAQDSAVSDCFVKINLPADSPVALLGTTGSCRPTARGPALMLDVNVSLTVRNISANRIHGVRLRVVSQEVVAGGVATVYQPSLNVGPGETFPMRIVAQLMRPTQVAVGPLVQVNLDGVLFQDLSFYGENRLHSRRIMTANEMEAQRDREYLKRVLEQGGVPALREAILRILKRQDDLPQLTGRWLRGGHAVTNAALAAVAPEHEAKFASLQFPDSPIQLMDGSAMLAGNEARAPSIEVRNVAREPLRYVELGLVLTDAAGRQYLACSLPSTDPAFSLPPGATTRVSQQDTLNFSSAGQPVNIQKMTSFVSQVEYSDGKVWVPNRQNLDNSILAKVLAPSAEEQRLSDLYVRKSIDAVVAELKKF